MLRLFGQYHKIGVGDEMESQVEVKKCLDPKVYNDFLNGWRKLRVMS